jgi:hypothetical protein
MPWPAHFRADRTTGKARRGLCFPTDSISARSERSAIRLILLNESSVFVDAVYALGFSCWIAFSLRDVVDRAMLKSRDHRFGQTRTRTKNLGHRGAGASTKVHS